jgi:type IV fimbrial biogenesis protein FimT
VGKAPARGFTLIEMMMTFAVIAILATLAVPSFNEAMLSSRLNTFANNFVASAQLARSEAIKRNTPVTLSASAGGWRNGWVVSAGGTVVHTQAPLPAGYRLSGNVASINFQPTGVGATAANLTLCRAAPTVGTQQRVITVSATGRPGVQKTTGTSC